MSIAVETIITLGSFLGALCVIFGYYNKVYKWIQRQDEQDKEQDKEIAEIKDELVVITYGVLASLKGLKEQGCDGPVTDAINAIEKHMNKKAHE